MTKLDAYKDVLNAVPGPADPLSGAIVHDVAGMRSSAKLVRSDLMKSNVMESKLVRSDLMKSNVMEFKLMKSDLLRCLSEG